MPNPNKPNRNQNPLLRFRSSGPSWVHESPFLHVAWDENEDEDEKTDNLQEGREGNAKKRKTKTGVPVGASSLRYLAMRKTLADQRCLRVDMFGDGVVPWNLAREMWECLGKW